MMATPFVLLVIFLTVFPTASANKNPSSPGIICSLKVLADYTFYHDFAGSDQTKVDVEIDFLIGKMDMAFAMTDLDSKKRPVGFNRTKQHTVKSQDEPGYLLADEYTDADLFLAKIATYPDVKNYCMTLVFTYRPFEDNTCDGSILGRVPQAFPNNQDGICGQGINVAFVTYADKNGDRVVPRDWVFYAIIHEMGHAFGAMNDEDETDRSSECAPAQPEDKFIMSEQATGCYVGSDIGYDNWKFSPCSIDRIKKVIEARDKCLVEFNYKEAMKKAMLTSDGKDSDD